MSTAAPPAGLNLDRVQKVALIAGGVGLLLCVVGLLVDHMQFFRSYLIAYCFCLGLPLGCLAILMLQYVTGGAWGLVLRRLLEGGTRTIPLMALLFLPLAAGVHSLYSWTDPEVVAAISQMKWKAAYLNVPFFLSRAALYFVVWLGLMFVLNWLSRREDRTGEPGLERKLRILSAPGLGLYGLTMTFAAIDWAMSLTPMWYSTMYGVLFAFGQVLSAFCFLVALFILLAAVPPLNAYAGRGIFRDLGSLLLAFVMIWAYLSFSQYLLVWSANLREEVPWYLDRTHGGWQAVALLIIVGHFILPFMLLLSGEVKRNSRRLLVVAVLVLVMRFVDMYWLIAPSFAPGHFTVHWLDAAALVGVGGVWLAFFLWQLRSWPLLPTHDPRLHEVSHHE